MPHFFWSFSRFLALANRPLENSRLKSIARTFAFGYSPPPIELPLGAISAMICPRCRSENCFRSGPGGLGDDIYAAFGQRCWRCHMCDRRFHARRVAISFALYAHCPRCGNFDLERASRNRVDWGLLISLKRWLGFPSYRCDPCRRKFFSVRPVRRIVPSTLPSKVAQGQFEV